MSLSEKLIRAYFDRVYNPLYDFTTAQFVHYRELQKECLDKLEFEDGDRVLCAGVGTGNEILGILEANRNVGIVGVDCSRPALQRAYEKALARGKQVEVFVMDARRLEFPADNFNKVLCLHVMDFITDDGEATTEILRVLKRGGQFVITYPSGKEGIRMGVNLLKASVRRHFDSGKPVRAFLQLLVRAVTGLVYLPLLLRPRKKSYSRRQLEALFTGLTGGDFSIEEYPLYQDFIVYGRK
ncbi:MAG: methyltransferase domain-containing protein [Chloroflexi bacterium]|nr:methyltransferase domain-containing protein [Chloroflexota bacterium]